MNSGACFVNDGVRSRDYARFRRSGISGKARSAASAPDPCVEVWTSQLAHEGRRGHIRKLTFSLRGLLTIVNTEPSDRDARFSVRNPGTTRIYTPAATPSDYHGLPSVNFVEQQPRHANARDVTKFAQPCRTLSAKGFARPLAF